MEYFANEEDYIAALERRRKFRRRLGLVVLVVLVGALGAGIAAWSQRDIFAANFDTAVAAVKDGDYPTAVIHLKSLLQQTPQNALYRGQLGHVYLLAGNPKLAEKELARAYELGDQDEAHHRSFAEALVLNGELQRAALHIRRHGERDDANWIILQAMLDAAANRYEEARTGYQKALGLNADSATARRGLARSELALGNMTAARVAIDKALSATPDDIQSILIKGGIELATKQYAAARDAYLAGLVIKPEHYGAMVGAVRAYLGLGEWVAAQATLDKFPERAEQDPEALYLRALTARGEGDNAAALDLAKKVLHIQPRHISSIRLAAEMQFEASEYSNAKEFVERILEINPQDKHATQLLGSVQLAMGHLDRGMQSLNLNHDEIAAIDDAHLLSLVGGALARNREHEQSQALFERAEQLAPDSLEVRMNTVTGKLLAGDYVAAEVSLEQLASDHPTDPSVQAMLVTVSLMRNEFDEAFSRAQRFADKHPKIPVAKNVLGLVHERKGDLELATASFNAAIDLDNHFYPAQLNLARVAVKRGDREQAKREFRKILEGTPQQIDALLGLSNLSLAERSMDEALNFAKDAQTHHVDRFEPLLLLSRLYYLKGQAGDSLESVKAAYALAPYAKNVQVAMVHAAIRYREPDLGWPAWKTLNEHAPGSIEFAKLELELLAAEGKITELDKQAQKLLERAPDDIGVNHAAGRSALAKGDFKRAHVIAKKLVDDLDQPGLGYELQGDVYTEQTKLADAVDAYAAALEAAPSSQVLMSVVRTERQLGIDPAKRLASWLDERQEDAAVRRVYGTVLHAKGSSQAAIEQYERVLDAYPADAFTLNNLAWLYHETNNSRALDTAARALKADPERPEVMDTYGWLLFKARRLERAVNLLTQASEKSPNDPNIKYHLAAAHAELGQNKRAKRLLEEVLQPGTTFTGRAEAEDLRASLSY